MKLQELMPELGSLQTQLTKVFKEQQGAIDELKLKAGDLETRLANTEIPEDAKGVIGELRALITKVDDTIPDVSNPNAGIELGNPPVNVATTGNTLAPAPRPNVNPPTNVNPVVPTAATPAEGNLAPATPETPAPPAAPTP